jgi:hypothetical protein
MAQDETLDEVVDRLYGLPLEEFTPQRDAAAKQLRADGARDAATAVKRLRKPSRLAWALNQVRRQDPEHVDELLAAGRRLQEAQRQLVEAGERGLLRDAAAEERELVGQVAELAERVLADSGHPASATAQGKLFSTLHAAAGDPEVRDELAAGRLLGEHQISDLGLVSAGDGDRAGSATRADAAAPAAPRAPARPRDTKATGPGDGKASRGGDAGERKAREAAERKARAAAQREARQLTSKLERARERSRALAKEQKKAERGLADAEKAAARAAAAAERAATAVDRARSVAQEAAARVREIEEQLQAVQPAR